MVRKAVWGGLLATAFALASTSGASAQDTLTFTLDEVSGAAQAEAEAQAASDRSIAESLGALRWGMSKSELLAALKAQIRAEYEQRARSERDYLRQDAVYQEANARYRRVRDGFVAFDGHKTGWDASPLVDEFRHGSGEAMLFSEDADARHHYFFVNDRLWKWYRELKSPSGDHADYARTAARLVAQLGKGRPQTERSGAEGLSWQDEHTRVTLLRRGVETCLVFEDLATLGRLAGLRENAQSRAAKTNPALERVLMTPDERECGIL